MVAIMLVVIGCYALAAWMVHIIYRLSKNKDKASKHYVLVAGNEAHKMEWYLRSFMLFAKRTGAVIRLTVVNRGSTDDTLAIAGRLAAKDDRCIAIQTCSIASETETARAGAALGESPSPSDGYKIETGLEDPNTEQPFQQWTSAERLVGILRHRGMILSGEQPIVVDLQNPYDLYKFPF